MYKVFLRNVVTGQKKWWDKCCMNAAMEKGKIIYWQSPEDEEITTYKIIAFEWQEQPKKDVIWKHAAFDKVATEFLLDLDIPDTWREELLLWKETNHG